MCPYAKMYRMPPMSIQVVFCIAIVGCFHCCTVRGVRAVLQSKAKKAYRGSDGSSGSGPSGEVPYALVRVYTRGTWSLVSLLRDLFWHVSVILCRTWFSSSSLFFCYIIQIPGLLASSPFRPFPARAAYLKTTVFPS